MSNISGKMSNISAEMFNTSGEMFSDEFESILSSNNDSINVSSKKELKQSWNKLSVINRSLFSPEWNAELDNLIDPVKEADPKSRLMRHKFLSQIRALYNAESFDIENAKKFFTYILHFIQSSDGYRQDKTGKWAPQPICAYTGFDINKNTRNGSISDGCKYPHFEIRTQKYLDIISNTIILFLKKIAKENPSILVNSEFMKIIKPFSQAIAGLYYFAGSKYNGTHLCNRLSNFVKNVNKIFRTSAGYDIIIQTGIDGNFMCGHGVLPLIKPDGTYVVDIHIGTEKGEVEVESLGRSGYSFVVGGTRRKNNKKKRTYKNWS